MFKSVSILRASFSILLAGFTAFSSSAQQDSLLQNASLNDVVKYAIAKQPDIQQQLINQDITDLQIKTRLADWYPQVNFNYLYQHNFQVQTNIIGGNPVRLGVGNTSALQLTASQAIFNRDLLLANRTKDPVRQQTRQQTESLKIDVATSVSKAFYDVLATAEQIKVADENIVRLERSLKDAKARYEAGIVDKTDFKRATIALNNAKASRKSNEELIKAKEQYLKSLMNYPEGGELTLSYDSLKMEQDIFIDTLSMIDYTKRIEYQILSTQRILQEANVQYNKWSYLPTLSANGAYIQNFLNDNFSKLYGTAYPQSYAGITLGFPIFQGGKRKYNLRIAESQLKQTDLQLISLKNNVSAEYSNALAAYQSGLINYLAIKENVQLAQEVYDVINLQYSNGIKTYLEVITAETDLRTARINYYNALYQVLSSKIDVQRAKGEIVY